MNMFNLRCYEGTIRIDYSKIVSLNKILKSNCTVITVYKKIYKIKVLSHGGQNGTVYSFTLLNKAPILITIQHWPNVNEFPNGGK